MPTDKQASTDLTTEINSLAVDDMMLAGINNLSDLASVMDTQSVETEEYSEAYSSGFGVLNDKSALVGVPILLVQWRFTQSKKFDGEFVSVYVVTADDKGAITGKYIINDGSTGIAKQLRLITDTRVKQNHKQPQAGLTVKNGLRKSEYETEQQRVNKDTGEIEAVMVPGETFYLA